MKKNIYKKCGLIEGAVYPTNTSGDLLVVKVRNCYEVDVEFVDTGYATTAEASTVRKGEVKDKMFASVAGVGCLGVGPHLSSVGRKMTVAYNTWGDMINRCYNPKAKDYPYYGGKGVYVCAEWLNFQNFATWYHVNYPTDGGKYHLDKDGLHTGDGFKVYSPLTCQFVTPTENLALVTTKAAVQKAA